MYLAIHRVDLYAGGSKTFITEIFTKILMYQKLDPAQTYSDDTPVW